MSDAQAQPRISTGNPRADEILEGGLPANSINIVMGQPGTGKTIFAQQLMFRNATPDRPVVYLATLSEPLSKVLTYLQKFDFFDDAKLEDGSIVYEEIGSLLARDGIRALVPRLKEVIKAYTPAIVVIDSFRALHDLSESRQAMRRMVYDLAGALSAYETTSILVGEYTDEHVDRLPEFAVADGIVSLLRRSLGTRDERYFRVLKLRGSGFRTGLHGLRITDTGLDVYPRLVTPDAPTGYESAGERVTTGDEGLDRMLGGGVWRGTTTLVAGQTGAGKTALGLQFAAAGLRNGETGLYVHFQENPTQLRRMIAGFGLGERADGLHTLYASPVELQIDSIIVDITRHIEEIGVRRVVLDSVSDLELAASDPPRLHDYMYALVQHFAVRGVTSMFTMEIPVAPTGLSAMPVTRVSYMCDNLLLLECPLDNGAHRNVRVIKTRRSGHDHAPRTITLAGDGLRVVSETA